MKFLHFNQNQLKNINFKFIVILIFFNSLSNLVLCQKIVFDATTLVLDISAAKFKNNAINAIEVSKYVPAIETLEFDVTFTDVQNVEGIRKFATISSGSRFSSPNTYFFSFKVEDKDYTNIKIIRKDPKGVVIESRTYSFRNHGGVKFDVSTGFFGTNLRDNIYVLKYLTDTSRQIVQEKSGNFRGGIGLLAHLHSRFNCPVNIGFSLGFEINSDTKVGYLGGGSLFFGYDKKFVFNFGAVASKLDEISNTYAIDDVLPNVITSVPTVKVWRLGYFIGVSYNF